MIHLQVRSYLSYDSKDKSRPTLKDISIVNNLIQALRYSAEMARMPRKSVQFHADTLEGNCEDPNYPYTHIWYITIDGIILFPENLHYFMSVVDSLFGCLRQEVALSAFVAPLRVRTYYDD